MSNNKEIGHNEDWNVIVNIIQDYLEKNKCDTVDLLYHNGVKEIKLRQIVYY
jgi:hypothetical protein